VLVPSQVAGGLVAGHFIDILRKPEGLGNDSVDLVASASMISCPSWSMRAEVDLIETAMRLATAIYDALA
jgi:hypothetical protein